MSVWVELTNFLIQAQSTVQTCESQGGAICPATAFNPVAAAFATQGYFMQADVLYYLTGSSFGIWAPFLYLIAAAGGLISLALGAPPKMYVWFFIGPGIYHWLVETRLPAHGVQWQIGATPQDQRAVWRLAHVGIKNNSLVARMAGNVPGASADPDYELKTNVKQPDDQNGWCKPTADPVYVSDFFLQFDDVVSYTVRRLVDMTGITQTSNITDSGSLAPPTGGAGVAADDNRWYLVADKKWALLDTITSAKLNSANLRDAFVTFLSSECGDALSSTIDQASFVVAANSGSGNLPCSVMQHKDYDAQRSGYGASCNTTGAVGTAEFEKDNYTVVENTLNKKAVFIPDTLKHLFQDDKAGSFIYYLNAGTTGGLGSKMAGFYRGNTYTECHQIFYTIMQGFRWEASQVFSQLKRSGPAGLDAKNLLFNLFYGWGARQDVGGALIPPEDMEEWTRNLIFVHLLRNEMAIAPRIADKKYTNQVTLDSYSQNFTSQTGAKTKYGEVYSWARMVPYMQGIMLYLLAMGYPFACMMMVMPGWHKTLFTWMSFWVWVKLWDAGFAVVTVVERSIWAMLGNSTKLNYSSPLVYQMKNWSTSTADAATSCPASYATADCFSDMKLALTCQMADSFKDGNTGGALWWYSAALFDRAMTLAASIDIDVANGYYIYLMSALYFAVPAATGQLVLGAKAGVAGMVNGLVQGVQQDGGRGASSGFLGNFRGQAAAGAAAMRQEAHAKGLKASGFVEQSLGQANRSLDAGFSAGLQDAAGRQQGYRSQALGSAKEIFGSAMEKAQAGTRAMYAREAGVSPDMSMDGFANPSTSVPGAKTLPKAIKDGIDSARNADTKAAQGVPQSGNASGGSGGSDSKASGATIGSLIGGGSRVNGMYQGMWGDPRYQAGMSFSDAGYASAKADFSNHFGRENLAMTAGQAARSIDSFGSSSGREAYGIGERRYGAAADFAAQTSVFNASVGLSDSAAGYIGSIGGDASVVSPTSKPTDVTGMAMSGRLGMSAQSASNYAMGDFHTGRANAISGLQKDFGSSFVTGDINQALGDTGRYGANNLGSLSDWHANQFTGANTENSGKAPGKSQIFNEPKK